MRYSLEQSVAPAAEPVTRAEAKLHLRVESSVTDDDALIDALVKAAREWAENHTRRSFVRRTYVLRMDGFASEIRLPRGPVASVSSIQYVDASGATQTFGASNYQVDTYAVPARIVLVSGATWPTVKVGEINAARITYVAGYAPGDGSPTDHAENVPAAVKAAIKLIVGHLYEHREVVADRQAYNVPFAVTALLAPYVVRDRTLE